MLHTLLKNIPRRGLRVTFLETRCFLRTPAAPVVPVQKAVVDSGPSTRQLITIPGRATVKGTEQFIMESGLKLFHQFNVSKLYINPIIHGPPRLPPIKYRKHINLKLSDKQLITAVVRNCSNMVYVYNHYSSTHVAGYWNSSALPHMFLRKTINGAPNPHYKAREGIITVAGLGMVAGFDQVVHRLNHALATTGLEFIDFAVIECDDATFWNETDEQKTVLSETIAALEMLCTEGTLQSYAVQIAVKPFTNHTPPTKTHSNLMMVPSLFEDSITQGQINFCDLMIYPISPTHAVPHTYPMLDVNPAVYNIRKMPGETSEETQRKFTRAALDPFNCYAGGVYKEPSETEGSPVFSAKDAERQAYSDPLEQPSIQAQIQKGLDSDIKYKQEKLELKKSNPDLTDEEIVKRIQLKNFEESVKEEEEVIDDEKQRNKEIKDEVKRLIEKSRVPDLILISGLGSPEADDYFGRELDDHCVLLESTPKLQDKALRIVLSVGCEVVVVDSELSANIRKLTLEPRDLLNSDETNQLFGEFGIVRGEDEDD